MSHQGADCLETLLKQVRTCRVCEPELPLGARPVLRAAETARILVIGQAPGTRVHQTGVPWNDASGIRLRQWMGIGEPEFYDQERIAIIPMGFCYPGKGKSGDLPPRKECAVLWHQKLLDHLPQLELTLLIGQYAQNYYLDKRHKTLTERVNAWREYLPQYFPLPHPSPRNNLWLGRNPWFEKEVVVSLRKIVSKLLSRH